MTGFEGHGGWRKSKEGGGKNARCNMMLGVKSGRGERCGKVNKRRRLKDDKARDGRA